MDGQIYFYTGKNLQIDIVNLLTGDVDLLQRSTSPIAFYPVPF